jgi:hypothetical protein
VTPITRSSSSEATGAPFLGHELRPDFAVAQSDEGDVEVLQSAQRGPRKGIAVKNCRLDRNGGHDARNPQEHRLAVGEICQVLGGLRGEMLLTGLPHTTQHFDDVLCFGVRTVEYVNKGAHRITP